MNLDHNINIAVRIKPFANTQALNFRWNSSQIIIEDKHQFNLDYVIEPNSTQSEVFEKIGLKIIENVLQGYNGCIFVYGQTGSGKTHTMTGIEKDEGLVQRCLKTLWNCVSQSQHCQIKLSYYEIYNELIKDLLHDGDTLPVRQDVKNGFFISNLSEHSVNAYGQFDTLIKRGLGNRNVKQTKMNSVSSRSHSVLEIKVMFKNTNERGVSVTKHSNMSFIDLAGSQKQKETLTEGIQLKQAANINKSLSNLSLVISKLSQNSEKKGGSGMHIPFRNSVLTKILKKSLTGKSKILIVCAISAETRYLDQTLSTLRFAQTAKSIKMQVKKNQQQYDGQKQFLFEELEKIQGMFRQLKERYDSEKLDWSQLKLKHAQLRDQLQKKQAALNLAQINNSCNQMIQSQIILQKTLSQFHSVNENCNSQLLNFSQFQRLSQITPISDFSHINNISTVNEDNILGFKMIENKPKSDFPVIRQVTENQEEDWQLQKQNLQNTISSMKLMNDKLKIENEFLFLQKDLLENELHQSLKRMIIFEQTQNSLQQNMQAVRQMVRKKNFDHAQKLFLQTCIKHTKRQKQLSNQLSIEKQILQRKLNQMIKKVKSLLESYAQSSMISGYLNDQIQVKSSRNHSQKRFPHQQFDIQRFSQHQRQVIKAQYDELKLKYKDLSQEFSRNRIKLFEKQGLYQQKVNQVDELNFQIQILTEQLSKSQIDKQDQLKINANILAQLSKKKSQLHSQNEKLKSIQDLKASNLKLQQQLQSFKAYMLYEKRSYQTQSNKFKLKAKQLQLGLQKSYQTTSKMIEQKDLTKARLQKVQNNYDQKVRQLTQFHSKEKQFKGFEEKMLTLSKEKNLLSEQNTRLLLQNKKLQTRSILKPRQSFHRSKIIEQQSYEKDDYELSNHELIKMNQTLSQKQPSWAQKYTQKDFINIIQNQIISSMQQAANYFYQKCLQHRQQLQIQRLRIIQLQKTNKQAILKNQRKSAQLAHLATQNKQKMLQLRQSRVQLQQQNIVLKKRLNQWQHHSKRLEHKLHSSQQAQFIEKQKINRMTYYQMGSPSNGQLYNNSFISRNKNRLSGESRISNRRDSDSTSLSSQRSIKNDIRFSPNTEIQHIRTNDNSEEEVSYYVPFGRSNQIEDYPERISQKQSQIKVPSDCQAANAFAVNSTIPVKQDNPNKVEQSKNSQPPQQKQVKILQVQSKGNVLKLPKYQCKFGSKK